MWKKHKPHHLSAFSLLQAVRLLPNSRQVAMETISMATKIGRNYRSHPYIHYFISSKKEKGGGPCYVNSFTLGKEGLSVEGILADSQPFGQGHPEEKNISKLCPSSAENS